jgi:hypothetical protein
MVKKCNPLECKLFKRLYERIWDRFPCDEIILACHYRVGNGTGCNND